MTDMDKNAHLYTSNVAYSDTPQGALSLPWWVRVADHGVYEPKHGCYVEPLICGQAVFASIHADITKHAKHTVDIITWGFDPGMRLIRNGTAASGVRYGDMLIEAATRKKDPLIIRLLVWHDIVLDEYLMKNVPGYYGLRFPSVGSSQVSYYSTEHETYNANWFKDVITGKYPNICFHVRYVPKKTIFTAKNDEPWGLSPAQVTALFPTHHQKMVLIDYEHPATAVGYVMGHNSISDFWDTRKHTFNDPLRETYYHVAQADIEQEAWKQGPALDPAGGLYVPNYSPDPRELAEKARAVNNYKEWAHFVTKPYQDVSCRLMGSILYDLNHNFTQAWIESVIPSSLFGEVTWAPLERYALPSYIKKVTRTLQSKISDIDVDFIKRRQKFKPNMFMVKGGEHSVQLLRTQPMHGEKAIKECYANLTRQIHHYMFIQNQYIQYKPWAEHLKKCVRRLREAGYNKPMYIFMQTSTPEKEGMDIPTYDVAKALGASATMTYEHTETLKSAKGVKELKKIEDELKSLGINVVMTSLWSSASKPKGEDDYEEIYIHAKVAIVDDAAFTIGSANLNLRSMALDSELNIISQAQDVAGKLRQDLFSDCTGDTGPAFFGDMKKTYDNWVSISQANLSFMQSKQSFIKNTQIVAFHVDRKPSLPLI